MNVEIPSLKLALASDLEELNYSRYFGRLASMTGLSKSKTWIKK
jgi:hypothetical protein